MTSAPPTDADITETRNYIVDKVDAVKSKRSLCFLNQIFEWAMEARKRIVPLTETLRD